MDVRASECAEVTVVQCRSVATGASACCPLEGFVEQTLGLPTFDPIQMARRQDTSLHSTASSQFSKDGRSGKSPKRGRRQSSAPAAVDPTAKYLVPKQTRVLHGLSVILDFAVAATLLAIVFGGFLVIQVQVDGFLIFALIALFHLLFNGILAVAMLRNWHPGYSLYLSFGTPWVIASLVVFAFLLYDEIRDCRDANDMDLKHTRCFVPTITLFAFIVLQQGLVALARRPVARSAGAAS